MRMREGARRLARVEKSRMDGDRQGSGHAPRKLRFVRLDDHDRRDDGRIDLHHLPSGGHGVRRRYEERFSRRSALPHVHRSEVSRAIVSTTDDTTAAGDVGARSEGSGDAELTATTTLLTTSETLGRRGARSALTRTLHALGQDDLVGRTRTRDGV